MHSMDRSRCRGCHRIGVALAFALALVLAAAAPAARITLKDGTVLDGAAIKQGDQYWIKTTDGQTRYVPASQVKSVDDAARTAAPATSAGSLPSPAEPGGAAFQVAKHKADSALMADEAVTTWEEFLKTAPPDGPDQQSAKDELARYKALADAKSEKIGGKWLGGAEREAVVQKAGKLYTEAMDLARQNQTLAAQKKLEEALKVYPTGYEINFDMGYLALARRSEDEAIRCFENALRKQPDSNESMVNLAIALFRKKQYERAIDRAFSAAKIGDDIPTAVVLAMVTTNAPPAIQRASRNKEALESAKLLAAKYGIDLRRLPTDVPPVPMHRGGAGAGGNAPSASGTGFLIGDSGLILTNRHVVQGFTKFTVLVKPGDERPAEVVVMDDKQDLALIRIKPKTEAERLPFLRLSPTDSPGDGAECTVMGYPMIDRLGRGIKVTRGIVSGNPRDNSGADVLTDAKVNPGNSGGPILDRFGYVMAIVSMKSMTMGIEDSYGIGISAGQIRKFLAQQNMTVQPGEAGGAAMSAEEIAAKTKPATVCILASK